MMNSRWRPVMVLLVLIVGWPLVARQFPWRLEFPFMALPLGAWTGAFVVSLGASAVYVSYTVATYAVAKLLPASAVARFFARNTVIVFIVHMPVYYLMQSLLVPITTYAVRVTLEFFVCFVLLAVLSEWLRAALRPDLLRERLGGYLAPVLDWGASSPRPAAQARSGVEAPLG